MNVTCATCARPLPDEPMPNIGGIRFCCRECVIEWRLVHPANVPAKRRWFA